jgi:methionyl-tRNA formyltransferase
MKIIFIGTVKFSRIALQKLIDLNAQVVGVCTLEKSEFNSDHEDLRPLCEKNKIPYKYIDKNFLNDDCNWIKTFNPDIIFCFGWSSLLKNDILKLAPMGILGYHPTKLPQNRGRHPLIWALALGLKKSASTFFFMDNNADSGEILSQKKFDILNSDDAQTLYNKMTDIALLQIEEFLPELQKKKHSTVKQNDQKANVWRKRVKTDGQIDFRMTSEAIYNLVRALAKPYGGAHVKYNQKEIIIWRVEIIRNLQENLESGKVLDVDDNKIIVKTYDGAIKIINHEFSKLPNIGEYL